MAKTEPFNRYLSKYEQWFAEHYTVYLSEIEVIRSVMPIDGKAAEIGVGSGLFAAPLGITEGVEPSEPMRKKAKDRGIYTIDGVAEKLPYADHTKDILVMITTICFVDDIEQSFGEIYRVLKDNGCLIIGFVDKDSPIGRKYQKYKDQSVFYKDAEFHSTGELQQSLTNQGFRIEQYKQTLFDSLEDISEVQAPREGYGEGSFVVIRAVKQ